MFREFVFLVLLTILFVLYPIKGQRDNYNYGSVALQPGGRIPIGKNICICQGSAYVILKMNESTCILTFKMSKFCFGDFVKKAIKEYWKM